MDLELSDSTVYEISIIENGEDTDLKRIIHASRVHLRIGYDPYAGQLFIMTKGDGKIRRVANAIFEENQL